MQPCLQLLTSQSLREAAHEGQSGGNGLVTWWGKTADVSRLTVRICINRSPVPSASFTSPATTTQTLLSPQLTSNSTDKKLNQHSVSHIRGRSYSQQSDTNENQEDTINKHNKTRKTQKHKSCRKKNKPKQSCFSCLLKVTWPAKETASSVCLKLSWGHFSATKCVMKEKSYQTLTVKQCLCGSVTWHSSLCWFVHICWCAPKNMANKDTFALCWWNKLSQKQNE